MNMHLNQQDKSEVYKQWEGCTSSLPEVFYLTGPSDYVIGISPSLRMDITPLADISNDILFYIN